MITGDDQKIAAQTATKVGIEEYFFGVLPEEKLQHVKNLQQNNYKVAMVGDGVNDAPSLAAADIGIAMGTMGTDAAIEAADVALMRDDITKVPYFFRLGKATIRTIKVNIFCDGFQYPGLGRLRRRLFEPHYRCPGPQHRLCNRDSQLGQVNKS